MIFGFDFKGKLLPLTNDITEHAYNLRKVHNYCELNRVATNITEIKRFTNGSWNSTSCLLIKKDDLNGAELKTVYLEEVGYLVIDETLTDFVDERNLNKVPWVGIIPGVFQSLANSLNFTYKLSKSRDKNWGA